MKLALLQPQPAEGKAELAMASLSRALVAAAAAGADMLVAPELMLPGYNGPAAHRQQAQDRTGPWTRHLSDLTRKTGCALVTGWSEREGDQHFNSVTAFGPEGEILAHHRKHMLFGEMEKSVFQPGDAPAPVFSFAGLRFGLLICYEIEFPEIARHLARNGAEVILVPTANPEGFEHVQEILVPARAYESRAFVAYANYCGQENGLRFGGRSVLVGPDGSSLIQAGTTDGLLVCSLPEIGTYPADRLSTQVEDLRDSLY